MQIVFQKLSSKSIYFKDTILYLVSSEDFLNVPVSCITLVL